jgi:hypothetical protein
MVEAIGIGGERIDQAHRSSKWYQSRLLRGQACDFDGQDDADVAHAHFGD